MQLPKNLLSETYRKPDIYLCETDKTKICKLENFDANGTFKFNSYSELSLSVPRTYVDLITGETKVYPYYDKVESVRLLYVEGFGYFEIQDPTIDSDGIKETKSIDAYSYEYTLSQKYLEDFVINTPDNEMNIGGGTPSIDAEDDPLVQFYNTNDTSHSLLHLAIKKAYGWSIGHVDSSLKTQTRSFEIDRESIYDFLTSDVAETYKCYFVFDTINNKINVYADTASIKFYGDGETKQFTLSQIFSELGSVTIDGYKTLEYSYDNSTGIIIFTNAPDNGSVIEIEDGTQSMWSTDVFVSFNNLASQMSISYSADDIKTVLTVTGSDDLDIRDVNLGLPYIMDLSYFYTVDWMGQDLYDAYTKYINIVNENSPTYTKYLSSLNNLYDEYYDIQNKTGMNLTSLKMEHFKTMLQYYYRDKNITTSEIDDKSIEQVLKEDLAFLLADNYDSTKTYVKDDAVAYSGLWKCIATSATGITPVAGDTWASIDAYNNWSSLGDKYPSNYNSINTMISNLNNSSKSKSEIETSIYTVLSLMLDEYGTVMVQTYIDSYTNVQEVQIDSGWSVADNDDYYMYWGNYVMLNACNSKMTILNTKLNNKQAEIDNVNTKLKEISNIVAMENNFTSAQLTRLNAFIREDEYSDDNFIITDEDTDSDILKSEQELLQCGKIELKNICQPSLSFSGTLANIYALDEFAPIVNQFQMGNIVRISLRPDYIKKSRIMEVNLNFEDFSDFSVTFGDLVSAKSALDIHADLLEQAANAGKSVASNSSYWEKGSDLATSTDIKLQNGLLDANTKIKATDGAQGIEIDKYGIHLRKLDENGEVDPKQAWMINNLLCYTDDNWETTRAALGEFTVDGETYYGLLAEAVIAGYIEGSKIVGGTIKIGEREDGSYNFEIDENGIVTFNGGSGAAARLDSLESGVQTLNNDVSDLEEKIKDIGDLPSAKMYRIEIICTDRNIMTRKNQTATLSCKVYSWDEDITDTIDQSNFNWVRKSSNSDQDEIWNSASVHKEKKEITISTEDIQNNASFSCQVNIPDE